jgi:hemoglobin
VSSMYERVGGMEFFQELTARFYQGVQNDGALRPLYPEDLTEPRRHLCLFLAQFWGGPRVYDEERGSPRLRARHLPFKIGTAERDAWLAHMRAAVRAAHLGALDEGQMMSYFEGAASHLVNQDDV